MIISILVAADENNAIGKDGDLPWKLSADLKYFKKLTTGHHIIMGRKTYESIGRPLPNRTNIVVTRNKELELDDVWLTHSIEDAIDLAMSRGENEVFIIGGGTIYRQSIDKALRIYLTRVHTKIENADTFFPKMDTQKWKVISTESHSADEKNQYDMTFEVYE